MERTATREETADMEFAARFVAKAKALGKPDLPKGRSPRASFLRAVARADYR